jgi:hypothetical protein
MLDMSYLHRLAHRFTNRRVTFAQPRPPRPTDAEEIAGFCQKYFSMRFLGALVFMAAIGAIVCVIAAIVGAFVLR